jgi:hypothetical protein
LMPVLGLDVRGVGVLHAHSPNQPDERRFELTCEQPAQLQMQ